MIEMQLMWIRRKNLSSKMTTREVNIKHCGEFQIPYRKTQKPY
jgi:hypothetical protein